jgi:hypothetical protein
MKMNKGLFQILGIGVVMYIGYLTGNSLYGVYGLWGYLIEGVLVFLSVCGVFYLTK